MLAATGSLCVVGGSAIARERSAEAAGMVKSFEKCIFVIWTATGFAETEID